MAENNEKKGFLAWGKPIKKPPKIEEINEQVQVLEATLHRYNNVINERFTTISNSVERIESSLKQIEETKNIPTEWLNIINKMKYVNPVLPETKIIWDVLDTYRNLNQLSGKMKQEIVKDKLADMKKNITERNIHNCSRCGKALDEGEYYKYENQFYCLSHQDEVKNNQADAGEQL